LRLLSLILRRCSRTFPKDELIAKLKDVYILGVRSASDITAEGKKRKKKKKENKKEKES
jgi:hypothetical protein